MVIEISSLSGLQNFARETAQNLKGGEILALTGNLGAGKTTFTKMLLKASGIRKNITSPTFVLMLPYRAKKRTFYHMDLYRIKGYKEVAALGIEELWNKKANIFVIEWAEKIKKKLPKNTIYFNFRVSGETRKITVKNASKSFEKNITA